MLKGIIALAIPNTKDGWSRPVSFSIPITKQQFDYYTTRLQDGTINLNAMYINTAEIDQ